MQLTIIYTAHLAADFALMPYVFSIIQDIRNTQVSHPMLLLDVGGATSSESWICQVTENRAPYLVLDAMGYHVVRADGLSVNGILGLQPSVQTRLVDDSVVYRWRRGEMQVNVGARAQAPGVAWLFEEADAQFFAVEQGQLMLFPIRGAVGWIQVRWPEFSIIDARRISFDSARRPDPTIVSAIEFVEREAQSYAHKKQRDTQP